MSIAKDVPDPLPHMAVELDLLEKSALGTRLSCGGDSFGVALRRLRSLLLQARKEVSLASPPPTARVT